jgi:hypothetical protein
VREERCPRMSPAQIGGLAQWGADVEAPGRFVCSQA